VTAGTHAYVTDYDAGLRIIDIADARNPQEIGYYLPTGSTQGLAVAGNFAYVANDHAGLRVVDISDPRRPREVGHYDTPGDARGVAAAGNYVYVADGDSGLAIIEFYGAGVEETPYASRLTHYAGPTIVRGVLEIGPQLTANGSRPGIGLFDANGRRVARLHAGANDVSRLTPGVYFVREAGSRHPLAVSRKVVIQR
jgi:DNA-binding beta-propeller fold protein YncE